MSTNNILQISENEPPYTGLSYPVLLKFEKKSEEVIL